MMNMRRILLFLMLTVIAFALPNKVSAWNFSSNTESPYRIELVFDRPYSKVMPMTFNGSGIWSSEVFTAQTKSLTFLMRPYWGKNDGECFDIGNYNYTVTPESGWINASSSGSGDASDENNRYKLEGLKVGSRYRIDITGGDTTFDYRVVELQPDNLYLYTNKDVEAGKEVKELASAANDNGTFTFNLYMEKGTFLFLSRNAGASTWVGLGDDFGRFNPDGTDIHLPGNDISFTSNDSGSWYVPTTGIYTVTVNWGAQKLSATNDISLYGNSPQWATKLGQASPTEYGKYVFTVDLDADEYLVLSGKNDGQHWGDINGFIWAPEKDTEAGSNIKTYFVKKNKNENGAWHVTKRGKYAIEVDCMQKTFKAFEVTVHMPLTSVDFAGNRKHYFLVGERMGEWHLQPEWEFKEVNGELVLNNRFIYNGAFAVGVVDNYDDYIHHTFTYYCQGKDFTTDVTSSDIYGTGRVYRQGKGKTRFNPSDVFYAKFDGEDKYFDGGGTYMSSIKVALNGDRLPVSIAFTKGSLPEAAKQRMFTLVGDNIINCKYNNTSGSGNTTMYNRGYDGWFDSWIQYDPATNTPYVDANGEYLYHTSFTPDYLTTHPVRFNLELQNGNEFAYSSRNVQFVEWSNLSNLDSDPYKDFYQAFSGRETIYNSGAVKAYGNEYHFKLNVECNNPETTPTADWNCYVIRDLWVGGLIKFWSGWGGNEDATNNGCDHLAVWYGPNGGPDIAEGEKYDVKGYDVKSGLAAVLYKNVARRGSTDYRISDGKPVYFNRVVLWYTNSDGVSNSYIQFIQESAGPAIFAQTVQNENDTSKKNYIKYHWYLNKSQNDTGKDAKVVSYEIERFRIVDGKPQPTGYPEGEKVDISDKGITVEQLYEENADNLAFTTHIDKGILDDRGFAPGLYE